MRMIQKAVENITMQKAGRKASLLCVLALAGCASPPPVLRPVTVEVPVSTPCVRVEVPKPDFALAHMRPMDDIAAKMRAALAEIEQRKAYEAELAVR